MLNQERVCEMTRLAVFDQKEGEKCKPMISYFRKDYIAKEMLKSFITGTIVFIICIAMFILANLEDFSEQLTIGYVQKMGVHILLCYGIGMMVYFIITYMIYYTRYIAGRQKVKEYYMHLKKIDKIYQDEERM